MTAYSIACIVVGSWVILAAVVAVPVGLCIRRADEQADIVRRCSYPPPPPAPRPRAEDDSTWLDAWHEWPPVPAWDDADEVAFRRYAEGAR